MDISMVRSPTGAAANWGRYGAMVAEAYPQLCGALVIDTGGKLGWDQMLRRTETMSTTADSFQRGGIESFVASLSHFVQAHADFHVTIVAHSMGAIIANRIIAAHGEELHLRRIIYMAPACGVEDFAVSVLPFLQCHSGVEFYDLCLHPTNERAEDHLEIGYGLGEIAPRGSLLQWIDDYYSSSETDFNWTLGKFENVVLAAPRLPLLDGCDLDGVYNRFHVKAFGLGTLEKAGPQRHGDFSEIRFWDPRLLQAGYWDPALAFPGVGGR
jgi:pimeloyl-ACP methyl ester carboxylesterase